MYPFYVCIYVCRTQTESEIKIVKWGPGLWESRCQTLSVRPITFATMSLCSYLFAFRYCFHKPIKKNTNRHWLGLKNQHEETVYRLREKSLGIFIQHEFNAQKVKVIFKILNTKSLSQQWTNVLNWQILKEV